MRIPHTSYSIRFDSDMARKVGRTIEFLFLLGFFVLFINLRMHFDDSTVDAKRGRAEGRFLLCSRGDQTLKESPSVRADVDVACRGYETLRAAYATQGVTPPVHRNKKD